MSFDSSYDATPATSAAPPPIPNPYFASTRPATSTPALTCHGRYSPERHLLEDFVRREFLAHFGARIRHFMPELLALHGPEGAIRGVVGCRPAAGEPLFLETYTREPIESVLAARNGFLVPRERIVEIGGLACRGATAAIAIVRALVPHLLNAGFTWVVFTGADTIMNVFRHLGLAPLELCAADPALLGSARHDWGTYYEHDPRVVAGRIADGFKTAQTRLARKPQ